MHKPSSYLKGVQLLAVTALVKDALLEVRVCGKVDGREGNVAKQACADAAIQAYEAELPDDRQGSKPWGCVQCRDFRRLSLDYLDMS